MEKDIFDTEISVYNGVRDVYGTTCKLRAFLFDKKHVPEIESPKYSEDDKTYPVFAQKCNLKEGGIS